MAFGINIKINNLENLLIKFAVIFVVVYQVIVYQVIEIQFTHAIGISCWLANAPQVYNHS